MASVVLRWVQIDRGGVKSSDFERFEEFPVAS
jgi:hypothetical protein